MIRYCQILIFLMVNAMTIPSGLSQTFYGSTTNSLYQFTIVNGNCTTQNIGVFQTAQGGSVFAGDICQCPDGSLYVTDNTNFYQIDPATAEATQISNNNSGYLGITGIGCSGNGLIYGGSLDFTGSFLYEIDPATGATISLGPTGFSCSGDVVFFNGIPYMSSTAGLVEINISNPAASTLILPSLSSNYVGMTVFPGECNTFLGGDFQGQLFLLNLETGNETPLCTLPYTAGGLTTLAEFDSADPCNIEIDLDGDNSSGGSDYDYLSQIVTCNTPSVLIADFDMTMTSPVSINYLTVSIISGLQNIGEEVLDLTSLPAGLTISGSGTTTLTIENASGAASISDFVIAIQNILYQNNAILPIAGERIISVVFYTTDGNISNIANAYVEVVELPSLTVNLGNDTTYCSGYTVYLDAGYPGSNYVWSTGETNTGILVSTTDEYSVTVSNAFACSGADTVNITFIPAYTSFEELILCQGDSVFLENEWQKTAGIYIDQYVSVNQCDSIITSSLSILPKDTVQLTSFTCDVPAAGVFTTLLTGSDGCDSLVISNIYLLPQDSCETIIIQEDYPLEIFAPNVFSPDFNGINDVFMLYSNDPTAIISTLKIFDRWGELIYQVNDCNVNTSACGWDGNFRLKQLDSGVFVYWAEIKRSNGEIKIINGDFTLIR